MSRRHGEEEEFSSSSFLDVICNVVGILIVLIVIAGVRTRPPVRSNPVPDVVAPALDSPVKLLPVLDEAPSSEPLAAPDLAAVEPDLPPPLLEPEPELEPLLLPEPLRLVSMKKPAPRFCL